ncbi:MAG TPA: hypothetical protein VH186_25895 [Chloroflexia bacterium]|nr:hypothetical protein [Chloroflexia bacterium]
MQGSYNDRTEGSKGSTYNNQSSTNSSQYNQSSQSKLPPYDNARQKTNEVLDQAQEKVGQVADTVRDQATSQINTQKDRAADSLGSVAHMIRQTGDQLKNSDQSTPLAAPIASMADQAASKLEDFSGYIRNHNASEIIDGVQDFARREPALFLGGAFALGLLASRFLRSSTPSQSGGNQNQWSQGQSWNSNRSYQSSYDRSSPFEYQGARTGGTDATSSYRGTNTTSAYTGTGSSVPITDMDTSSGEAISTSSPSDDLYDYGTSADSAYNRTGAPESTFSDFSSRQNRSNQGQG